MAAFHTRSIPPKSLFPRAESDRVRRLGQRAHEAEHLLDALAGADPLDDRRSDHRPAGIAAVADGAVVGSAIVERIGAGESVEQVLGFVRSLAEAAHAV